MRKRDEYFFSHKSIMEYLVAQGLNKEIENGTPKVFGRVFLERAVSEFMTEMNPSRDTLLAWIKSTRSIPNRDIQYLGGNAATLLCKLDRTALKRRNLSGTILNGAILDSADLTGTTLDGVSLVRVNLSGAKFSEKTLAKAKIRDITISIWRLEKGVPTDLRTFEYVFSKLLNYNKKNKAQILAEHHVAISSSIAIGVTRLQILSFVSITAIRKTIENISWVKTTAVFADEIEKLLKLIPEDVRPKFEIALVEIGQF
jgi:hypothetical protein